MIGHSDGGRVSAVMKPACASAQTATDAAPIFDFDADPGFRSA